MDDIYQSQIVIVDWPRGRRTTTTSDQLASLSLSFNHMPQLYVLYTKTSKHIIIIIECSRFIYLLLVPNHIVCFFLERNFFLEYDV